MAVTPEMIQKIRYELQDNTPGLYILDDSTLTYFLEKHSESISRATLDAARAMLFQLSQNATSEQVDVFSIKGSQASIEFRQALELYIKNPYLNPLSSNLKGWIGGVSKSEMTLNDANHDNNIIQSPSKDRLTFPLF